MKGMLLRLVHWELRILGVIVDFLFFSVIRAPILFLLFRFGLLLLVLVLGFLFFRFFLVRFFLVLVGVSLFFCMTCIHFCAEFVMLLRLSAYLFFVFHGCIRCIVLVLVLFQCVHCFFSVLCVLFLVHLLLWQFYSLVHFLVGRFVF